MYIYRSLSRSDTTPLRFKKIELYIINHVKFPVFNKNVQVPHINKKQNYVLQISHPPRIKPIRMLPTDFCGYLLNFDTVFYFKLFQTRQTNNEI